jgi:hypothetical protein
MSRSKTVSVGNSLICSFGLSDGDILRSILKLDQRYGGLLRHIQIGFLSEDGFSLLDKHFGIPPESVWHCGTDHTSTFRFADHFGHFRLFQS